MAIFILQNGSGYAYTPYVFQGETETEEWIAGERHSKHFPAYFRTDIEVGKSFSLLQGAMQINLRFVNIFNRENVFAYNYAYDIDNGPMQGAQVLYGFVPLVNVSYIF